MKPTSKGTQSVAISHQSLYQGPVPDPEALKKYEQIQPGFANRLISMAEKEQQSRIQRQNKIIEAEKDESKNYKRGQGFAFLSVILIVGLCAYGFFLGFQKESRDIGVAVIVGLASIFITGRFLIKKKNQKE